MKIAENIVLGLDLGIASVGWGLIDIEAEQIVGAGVWTFSAPETDKEKKPTNQIRQAARSMRRVVKRRRQRLNAIREFLESKDLLSPQYKSAVSAISSQVKIDPWAIRTAALERLLSPNEAAIALYHIAKHRGFQSNRKGGDNAEAGDGQKALKAIEGLAGKIAGYKTFGEALYRDPELSSKKRNVTNDYGRTPKRDWLRQELSYILEKQAEFGADWVGDDFLEEYSKIAFTQKSLQDQAGRVRYCAFEHGEKRSSKYAPSFETFRFLQKLRNTTMYMKGLEDWTFNPAQIATLEAEFGKTAKFTYKHIRKILKDDLDGNVRFRAVAKDEEDFDVATRKSTSADGTRMLKAALGTHYDVLDDSTRDDIMFAIAFHESQESVETALSELGLEKSVYDLLTKAVGENHFKNISGAAHISAKACRNIIEGLRNGMSYYDACVDVGYDPLAPDASPMVALRREVAGKSPTLIRKAISELFSAQHTLIGSPVARKALIEAVKQFVAIVYGHPALKGALPGQINVELARDVGKGAEERGKITSGIKKRNGELDKAAEAFENTFKRRPRKGSNDLLIFELANEQNWECLYSGRHIDPNRLLDGLTYQVDHILPWSRFGDDSFQNLTLCTASSNQAKKGRTAYEWMTTGETSAPDFDLFSARVDSCKALRGFKRRNYLLKNASEVEDKFRARNLNDTRWACRLTLQCLSLFYPEGEDKRRLFARPGGIIAKARKAWGLEFLKKDESGNRQEDDRHHAVDGVTIAAMTESMLQRLTKSHQDAEAKGGPRPFEKFDAPWPDMRDQMAIIHREMVVARAEERKVSGEKHKAGIAPYDVYTGVVFEHLSPDALLKSVAKEAEKIRLKAALEARFTKPERSQAIIRALLEWHECGSPTETPPKGPTGDVIKRIRVIAPTGKPAVNIRGGTADRGDMARVDVFSKPDKKGKKQFYLVPIYPHQVAGDNVPPSRAVTANKPEKDWPIIDDGYLFEFSVFQKSWVEIEKPDTTVISGYFRGMNRALGSINISPHYSLSLTSQVTNIGARTLQSFLKSQVDRLGMRHTISKEVRTWRGAEYISPKPPA